MAIKKIEIRPKGDGSYSDVLYPRTSIDQVDGLQAALDSKEPAFTKNTAFNKNFGTTSGTVAEGNHTHTKSEVGLSNVDNIKQMPISGGTFTGIAVAQANTSYTTRQLRNVIMSTADPSGGSNGDIWIKYK